MTPSDTERKRARRRALLQRRLLLLARRSERLTGPVPPVPPQRKSDGTGRPA